jgi:hypothetical protein
MVGLLLFENTRKVNWHSIKESLPVFITSIFCAFTYSILYGVIYGAAAHVIMSFFSGDFYKMAKHALYGDPEVDLNNYQQHYLESTQNSLRSGIRSVSLDPDLFRVRSSLFVPDDGIRRAVSEVMGLDSSAAPDYETFSRLPIPLLMIPREPGQDSGLGPMTTRTSTSDDSPSWTPHSKPSRRRPSVNLRGPLSLSIGESSILSYDHSGAGGLNSSSDSYHR